jgi:hypothetical protein
MRKEYLFLVKSRFVNEDGSLLDRGEVRTLIQGFGENLQEAAKEARQEFQLPNNFELLYYRG